MKVVAPVVGSVMTCQELGSLHCNQPEGQRGKVMVRTGEGEQGWEERGRGREQKELEWCRMIPAHSYKSNKVAEMPRGSVQ